MENLYGRHFHSAYSVQIPIQKIGRLPMKANEDDACFDCFANIAEPITIRPGTPTKIPLGFAVSLPRGWKAELHPRSGNALKGIHVHPGIIDCRFHDEVQAILFLSCWCPIEILPGDRVCQISFSLVEVVSFSEIENLPAGRGGFGSTGR